jgi:hypothetical protein
VDLDEIAEGGRLHFTNVQWKSGQDQHRLYRYAGIVPGIADADGPTLTRLMKVPPERRLAMVAFLMTFGVGPRQAAPQSASQLGAWDGLMLSPVGALAPVARDPGEMASRGNELSLRYGRWRYDADDAVHDNIGLTWSHSLGFAKSLLSLTGAAGLVECPTCSAWELGGVDLQSTLWDRTFAGAHGRPITAGAGLRASVGGARYRGSDASSAVSAAIAMPIDIALPLSEAASLCASIVPGFGFGRIEGTDLAESGMLPMVGAAVAWTLTSNLGLDLGVQRIVIAGGPTQLGAALSWRFGSHRDIRP